MNETATSDTPPLRDVTILLDNRPLVITPADGLQIAAAMQRYLDANLATAEGVALPRVAGPAWVDSRGALRVGGWTLGSRIDHLVLTLREAPPPGTMSAYLFTASLVRATDGWVVPAIGLSRVQYR